MLDLTKFDVFIVGGYVRDRLLGREGKDHDFVVVGATPQDMFAAGFGKVGADFPVFLHPITGDEFALARQERKVGPGYQGFETNFDPSITLEDDLIRRDLTINSMARRVIGFNEKGHAKLDDTIIDPFNGQADLAAGILRHTSDAFGEDPVRVLRVARFAARYNFRIANETWDMMKWMVRDGELNHLTKERVWQELSKAIMEPHAENFFAVMRMVNADRVLFPKAFDRFTHLSTLLPKMDEFSWLPMRIAGLFAHTNIVVTENILKEFRVGTDTIRWIRQFQQTRDFIFAGGVTNAANVLKLLKSMDAKRQEPRFMDMFWVFTYLELPTRVMDRFNIIREMFAVYKELSFRSLSTEQQESLSGPEIGQALDELALERMAEWKDHKRVIEVVDIPELP